MFLNGFEKTAKDKKKLKFDPNFDQEQFAKYVKKKADHIPKTGKAAGKPKDYEWQYVKEMPLDFAKHIKKDWKAWFENEEHEWKHDHHEGEREGHFDKWSEEPELKPVILVEGTDKKLHIWDGHHRIAKAIIKKMKCVPALVGKPKGKE